VVIITVKGLATKVSETMQLSISVKLSLSIAFFYFIECEEYEKYTYEEFYGGGLSGDSKPSIHKSSKCSSSTGLIVGGQNAEEREFPHMVAIGYGFEGSYEYACGGTLISEQFVLTAAHCERANGGAARIVKLGTNNLKSQNSQDVPVASFIKYPKYNSISKFADIALIKMQRPVSLEIGGIRPACLHTGSSSLFSRNKAVATGWGSIEYGDVSSDILQKVTLDIFTSDVCEKDYDKVFKEHICAGKTIEKLDTCQGGKCLFYRKYINPLLSNLFKLFKDSGGPLQVPKNDNSCLWYVVGITSYGKGCGLRIPSLYTKVNTPEFLNWIEGIVWRS
jgi:secreted trypsin-like serine protease